MRKISPSLVITIAALWAGSAHATPDQAGNRSEKNPSDTGLLTQINQARQSVSHRASELVAGAMRLIGVPYQRGGSSAETGFDCSGFVRAVYAQSIGLLLPRKAEEQASATQHISKNDLRPGDLVFFNTMRRAFSHVGIYVGNGKFIHSPKPGSEVRIDNMAQDYWQDRFDGARRVPAVASSQPYLATSLAALSDEAGPGTGVSLGAASYTGASASANTNAIASGNTGATASSDSSAAARTSNNTSTLAATDMRTATSAGVVSGERSAKTEKLKPAQAKKLDTKKSKPEAKKSKLEAKKGSLKKHDAKKQTSKKQEAKQQQAKKRESTKHASASGASKASKAKKRAKA